MGEEGEDPQETEGDLREETQEGTRAEEAQETQDVTDARGHDSEQTLTGVFRPSVENGRRV